MAGIKGQRSGGRNRRTPDEHRLAGTFRPHRHEGTASPKPPHGRPEPPEPLDGDALAEWERMVRRLEQSGSLSTVDDQAIYQCARLFAETEAIARTQAETAASIAILEDNIGTIKKDAPTELVALFQEITKLRQLEARYTTQVRQGRMAIRMYLTEFGLTPASRGRVKLPEKKEQEDPFERFMARGQH